MSAVVLHDLPAQCEADPVSFDFVPVQALETWLLALRGDVLADPPENALHKRHAKALFFRRACGARGLIRPTQPPFPGLPSTMSHSPDMP